jgi:hypothetical protein
MQLRFILVFLVFFQVVEVFAQTIPVGYSNIEELMRRNQVNGIVSDDRSYCIRPLQYNQRIDTVLNKQLGIKTNHSIALSGIQKETGSLPFKAEVSLLPISMIVMDNTHHPYGWNMGAMYPAKGLQTLITTGLYAKLGPLEVQLKPEIVYAQNLSFPTFPAEFANQIWATYFASVLNGIDAPEQFGVSSIKKIYAGQSGIKLNFLKMQFGVSTENLWWGPGIRNSIMMSNSAPGFLHWTFNSKQPIKTAIGSFEWQLIGGTLKQSGILPSDTNRYYGGARIYNPKPIDTRYISGISVTWHPKWISGMFLGINRSTYMYSSAHKNAKGFILKYVPVIQGLFASGQQSGSDQQDQLFSVFFRQVLPKDKAEFYFEWARNDHAASLRDLLLEPEHSRAYTVGFTKSFDLKKNKLLQISSELTQLQIPPTYVIRQEPTWYVHQVADGYTNEGRYLGAGIGPGSNTQSLDISIINNTKKVGILFERYVHNNDFYYQAFTFANNYYGHWVDISTTFHANWNYKNLLINAEMAVIRSMNYEWWHVQVVPINAQADIYKGNNDVLNLHASINLTYLF